jgi:hypothetical protein
VTVASASEPLPSFLADLPLARAALALAAEAQLRSRVARGQDPHQGTEAARLEHYLASLEMLEQITPEHPLVRQLRFELEVLEALPPRPGLLGARASARRA